MSDQCFAGPGCHTERSGRLREQFEGPAPEQPASIVRFLLLDRPLGPNVENEMDDPNMHAYGEDGPDDAEIGRQWRENSSLEKWFPLTAERLAAKERENLHLAREARTWWEACRDATGEAERLRGETDVLRAWIKAALVPLQSIADLEDFEDGGDGMNALIDAGRKFVRWSGLFGGNVNTIRGPASILGTPPTGNCGQCQWSAGRARSETRRIDKETEMHLSNLERYEIQAEAFRRMTGHLAPGKDAAAGSYDEAANRIEIYARWAEIHGECVYAVLDAVDYVLRTSKDDEE